MVFYDRGWNRFGTSDGLVRELHDATGIPMDILQDRKRAISASVAQKMSWASPRRTSRKEDTAYCLLGLFDINMPLLYGEGNKAFLRLQQEIIRSIDDESIFAWRIDDEKLLPLHKSGLLASSPRAFRDCSDITTCDPSSQPFNRKTAPYTITNRGLQFERPLLMPGGSQGPNLLPLNCRPLPSVTRNDPIWGWVSFLALLLDVPHENRILSNCLFLCQSQDRTNNWTWGQRRYSVTIYRGAGRGQHFDGPDGLEYFRTGVAPFRRKSIGSPSSKYIVFDLPNWRWLSSEPTDHARAPIHFELMNLNIGGAKKLRDTDGTGGTADPLDNQSVLAQDGGPE